MTQCYVFVFVVRSLFCICSTRCLLIFISRFILTFSCGRAVFDNRSTFGLQIKVVHVLLSSGPSCAVLYTLTKEEGSYRKSYVHFIINGGDPAIWKYVTLGEDEEETAP